MKQPKVALLTAFGERHNVPGTWIDLLVQLKWQEFGTLGLVRKYGHDVAVNRNQLAEAALSLPDEWFLWVDSDQGMPKGGLWRLLSWDKPIVAANVFKKEPDSGFLPVFYQHSKIQEREYDPMFHTVLKYMAENGNITKSDPNGALLSPAGALVKCDAVGFGCVLTHRSVFEKIEPPWFSNYGGFGEDLYFCRLAEQAGIEIYGDMGCVADHKMMGAVDHRVFLNRYAPMWQAYKDGKIPETDVEKLAAQSIRQKQLEGKTDWTRLIEQTGVDRLGG